MSGETGERSASLAHAGLLITAGTLLSRITGLGRVVAIAYAIGVAETRLADTYHIANAVPNIILDLVVGGLLGAVFVPVFVGLREQEGELVAWRVASSLLNACIFILFVVALLGMLVAPLIADFYASRAGPSAEGAQATAMTLLLRLLVPQILFYGMATVFQSMLNSYGSFGPPTFMPVLSNIVVIATFITCGQAFGRVGVEDVSARQLVLMGGGTTLGVVILALGQLPYLRRFGSLSLKLDLGHPAIRRAARLSAYGVGFMAVTIIGFVFLQWLANANQGAFAAYQSGLIVLGLPLGLLAVTISTVLLPDLSRDAAHARWQTFRHKVDVGLRMTLFFMIPSAVACGLLADRIASALLEHGATTETSSALVASAFRLLVIGLVPTALFQLLLRAFYAIQDNRTPFVVNVLVVLSASSISVLFFDAFGLRALASSYVVGQLVGAMGLGMRLQRSVGSLEWRAIGRSVLRMAAAGVGTGVAIYGAMLCTEGWTTTPSTVAAAGAVVFPSLIGAIVYLTLVRLLQLDEMARLMRLLPTSERRTT